MALWLLRNRSEKIRTVALGGLLAYEKIYVHGDVSATDAIGTLAAPYKNNIPLIEGEGHFGSRVAPSAIGAPRYTDVKRAKAAEALLYQDLDIIPLEDNYDGSNKQPKHFLPLIPLVLLNGVEGIAVGWSTKILPRDLKKLIEATKAAVIGEEIKNLPPSYSKFNCSISEIGQNRWEITGKVKVENNVAHITELPPGMDIEVFRKRLIEMENDGLIRDFTDKSTEAIDIIVRLKPPRDAYIEMVDGKKHSHKAEKPMNADDLIEFLKLRERVTERIVVLDWDGESIRTYDTAEEVVKDFVKWRLGWYTKRFEHLTVRDEHELQYWLALQSLFKQQFPKKLPFPDRATMQATITEMLDKIKMDDSQMDRLVSLPTYRWTKEFSDEVDKKIADLKAAIADYKLTLKSPKKLKDIYLQELDEIKIK